MGEPFQVGIRLQAMFSVLTLGAGACGWGCEDPGCTLVLPLACWVAWD